MSSIKYKTEDGYISVPLNIIGSRVYLEDYDDGEVIPELVDDNAKLGIGIGTCSTSSGNELEVTLSGYKLVKNGMIAVTFEYDVPSGATLNVNGKGAKPIYNEGSSITADTIKAGKTVMFCYDGTNYVVTSLGGSGKIPELLVVNLTSNDGDGDANLIGATITITDDNIVNTPDNIIYQGTWQGDDILVNIDEGIDYTINVGTVTDYFTPNSQSYTSVAILTRNVQFKYIKAYVDLGLSVKWSSGFMAYNSETQSYEIGQQTNGSNVTFSWGNITPYQSGEVYSNTPGGQLTSDISSGSTTYDAARANLGSPWRMPTYTEIQELWNNTNRENVPGGYKLINKSDSSKYIYVQNQFPSTNYIGGTVGWFQIGYGPQPDGHRDWAWAIRPVR